MELVMYVVIALVAITRADYPCLCNYDVEMEVFESMSESSLSLGSLYEFDCKEQLAGQSTMDGWFAIAYEHKVGYVKMDNNSQIQKCPGDAPDVDKVTTTTMATTSTELPDTTSSLPVSQTTATTTATTTTKRQTSTDTVTTTSVTSDSTTSSAVLSSTTSTSVPSTTTPIVSSTIEMTTSSTVPSTMTPTTTTTKTTRAPTTTPSTTTRAPSTTTPSTTTRTPSTTTPSTTTRTPSTTTPSTTTRTPSTTTPSTTKPSTTSSTTTSIMTTSQKSIVSGNTALCPVALRSFTAKDGGILTQYDQSCYEVVPHRHSWTYAERDCKTKGGHLLHIGNAAEQDYIYQFLRAKYNHNVWIGYTDINQEGDFQWASGDRTTYTHWQQGISNNHDCTYLRPQSGGFWYLGECSNSRFSTPHAYVCQYEIDTTSPLSGNVNPHGDGNTHKCPSLVQSHASRYHGVLGQYGQSCYELLPNYKVTWSHGERLCGQEGGHLVHIDNADEQSFLQDMMTRYLPNHSVWIGLNDRSNENTFEWSSGNPVTYTNWASDHANNFASHHSEDCAVFKPYQNGHWDDVTCGVSTLFGDAGEKHAIMCQFKVTTSSGSGIIG